MDGLSTRHRRPFSRRTSVEGSRPPVRVDRFAGRAIRQYVDSAVRGAPGRRQNSDARITRLGDRTNSFQFPYAARSMARIAVSGWLIGSTPTRLTMDVMVPSASASTQAARCSKPR
jgi:hypothetical protein